MSDDIYYMAERFQPCLEDLKLAEAGCRAPSSLQCLILFNKG